MFTEIPKYQLIYNEIKEDIVSLSLENGEKLPSELELSTRYEVSLITVKKALKMLEDEQFIIKKQGKGSFVNFHKSDKPNIIGIVMDDYVGGYGSRNLFSMEAEAEKNGYKVIALQSHGDLEKESSAIDLLLSIGCKAVIITPIHGEYYSEKILKLVTDNFPVVFIDRNLSGIRTHYVTSDNYNATIEGLEHLYSKGHKSILILKHEAEASTISDRARGAKDFAAAHADVDITFFEFSPDNATTDKQRVDLLANSLENYNCTAVFGFQYKFGILMKLACEKLGKTIPNDYSILVFDYNIDLEEIETMSYIRQDEEQMGKIAVNLAIDKITGSSNEIQNVYLETNIIENQSIKDIN